VALNFRGLERFEIAGVRGVKGNHDRHDFAQAELALLSTVDHAVSEQALRPVWSKRLTKVVDMTEESQ
jgi:hypothetical protein